MSGLCGVSPGLFVSEEGVEDGEEFVHRGDEREFLFLALEDESLIEGFDGRVEADGTEGGHVQRGPDGGSTAEDGALASEGSAVAVDGRDTDEGGDLLPGAVSEFGEFGDERAGGLRSDAGRGLEEFLSFAPQRAVSQPLIEFDIEVFELLCEDDEDGLKTRLDSGAAGLLLSVEFGGADADELSSASENLLQFSGICIGERSQRRLDVAAKLGEDEGVNGIGLGESADPLGEVSDALGVDDDDGQPGGGQFGDDQLFEAAGGFEHDDLRRPELELLNERDEGLGVVGDPRRGACGELADIEKVPRDIDADGKGLDRRGRRGRWRGRDRHLDHTGLANGRRLGLSVRHEQTLPCRYGLALAALATVRVDLETDDRDQALPRPQRPRGQGSRDRRVALLRSLRSLRRTTRRSKPTPE